MTSELVFSDLHSWDWQVLAEINLLQAVNASSTMQLGSRRLNYTSVGEGLITDYFPGFDRSVFPETPNTTYVNSLGGWYMVPSNVMWTNGEFDPWRAFSVMILDQDLGAPKRAITQDIPKCGDAPPGTDVFGLLFEGAIQNGGYYLYFQRCRDNNPSIRDSRRQSMNFGTRRTDNRGRALFPAHYPLVHA